jgi:hypothetical protein
MSPSATKATPFPRAMIPFASLVNTGSAEVVMGVTVVVGGGSVGGYVGVEIGIMIGVDGGTEIVVVVHIDVDGGGGGGGLDTGAMMTGVLGG